VADALAALDDERALTIIRSVVDAAYFSVLNLLDAGLKNSGVQVEVRTSTDRWVSHNPAVGLQEVYRHRVEPNGLLWKSS
jgi:hypothetical protein